MTPNKKARLKVEYVPIKSVKPAKGNTRTRWSWTPSTSTPRCGAGRSTPERPPPMPRTRKPSKPSPRPAPAKRRRGRPEGTGYHPTAEQRKMVEMLAGFVMPEEDIVRLIINPETGQPISPVTLRRHFRKELDKGFSTLKVRHHMALFKNVELGNVTAQIWWDKTRNHISERFVPPPPPAPGEMTDEGQERSMLEIGRRIAFALVLSAEIKAPQPTAEKPKAKRTKQPA